MPAGPLTRPAFFALAASGLGGCALAARAVRVLHRSDCPRGFSDAAALDDATHVRMITGRLAAPAAGGAVRYAIAIPRGAPMDMVSRDAHVDAVAYVLGGRGSTAVDAIAQTGLRSALGAWVRGGGRPFALAAIDAGESYFHARSNGEDRLRMVTRDLAGLVRRRLGVGAPREALIGFSMGGYGALLAAEREPRRHRAVAVAGPAIFPSYADERRSVGDAFDDAADYARNDVTAHAASLRGLPVLLRAGAGDPFVPGVRAFQRGAPPSVVVRIVPGAHDDCFWRASAPELVAFVGARL